MNCPICNVLLLISERQGIEIDYCQKCRGVWLDRGELDKLIERAGTTNTPTQGPRRADDEGYEHRNHPSEDSGFGMGGRGQHRERENPIVELFDFF